MFPVLQEDLKERVIEILRAQMADNQKARLLKQHGAYEKVSAGRSEPLRVQEHIYRQSVAEQERIRSLTPVRFAPIQGTDQ
jgi:polyphosphate kinase